MLILRCLLLHQAASYKLTASVVGSTQPELVVPGECSPAELDPSTLQLVRRSQLKEWRIGSPSTPFLVRANDR